MMVNLGGVYDEIRVMDVFTSGSDCESCVRERVLFGLRRDGDGEKYFRFLN